MKKFFTLLLMLVFAHLGAVSALAQDPATPTATPPATPAAAETVSKADFEALQNDVLAYMKNGAPAGPLKDLTGPGHNTWMMVATAFVLFMTLPGLALFYGGLVRKKNVLSVLAQCMGITGLVTILWWAFGYSAVFSTTGDTIGGILGAFDKTFLEGVTGVPNTGYCSWATEGVFAMYQMTFAIITPALIVGAIAERMKFSAVMAFIALWMVLVYFPLAHMVWGGTGMMNGVWNADASIKAIDFAGGTVVHMSSGWSALVLCMLLGKRLGYGKQPMPPHSMVLCMVGTGMLWVGWYGFNAGSACGSDTIAANAFVTTTLCTAIASFVWAAAEWVLKGKPSILGYCSGAVAGLVVITPGAGFVTPGSAVIIGILAGVIPFLFISYLKAKLGFDDALDTFGVHGIGGTLGAILTGVFADSTVNSNLDTNLKDVNLVGPQIQAVLVTIVLSVVGTAVAAFIVKAVIGLRTSEENETQGLDLTDHGEEGYNTAT
jgi:Amt family ammonium transporter